MITLNQITLENKEKQEFIQKNIDVFEGLGEIPDKISIKLNKNAIPKSCPPRRVLFKIFSRVQETLNKMEKLKVIKRANEPCE